MSGYLTGYLPIRAIHVQGFLFAIAEFTYPLINLII